MGMLWNGTFLNAERCAEGRREFSALILHVSPYLYPFSIEYSILVGTYLLLTPLLPKRRLFCLSFLVIVDLGQQYYRPLDGELNLLLHMAASQQLAAKVPTTTVLLLDSFSFIISF